MSGRVPPRGNVTPASSGRVDGPAACTQGVGPDGVRGVGDFCEPAKITDSPGLPTGDIPSRKQPTNEIRASSRKRTTPGLAADVHCTPASLSDWAKKRHWNRIR